MCAPENEEDTPLPSRQQPSMRSELRVLLPLALPIMLSSMLSFLMTLVDLLFIGHLGTHELAAAGLGNNYFSILQHPIFGTCSALDTLLSQAYGAKQMSVYRMWAQTGLLICCALAVPWAVLLGFAEPILRGCGVEVLLAASAARYCSGLIIGVPPFLAFLCLTKLLQAQNIVLPSVYVALISNVVNVLINWLLIYRLGMGFDGAPIATSIARWTQLALLWGYVHVRRVKLKDSLPPLHVDWPSLSSRAATFFQLGLPGALMLGLEAWFFEASTFMASFLGTASFAAHCVLLNVCAFTFLSFPFALGIAASIRVGHVLGAGDAARARATAKVTIAAVLILMSALSVAKIMLRSWLGLLFTDDQEVVACIASLVSIAALFQVSDGVQAAVGGVLRGMGKQSVVALVNFLGFWLIGATVGPALAFGLELGVAGLWWGMACGLTVAAAVSVSYIVCCTNWEAEAQAASQRAVLTTCTTPASSNCSQNASVKQEADIASLALSSQPLEIGDGWTELNAAARQAALDEKLACADTKVCEVQAC